MANPMLNSGPMLARGLAQSRASEPTYAALRAALAAGTYQAEQMVFVESIDGTNTNGAGIFKVKFDAGGGFVDNGGVMLTSADGTWAAERVFDGAVNARWFGAVGDGVTDDTAALQAWLNTAGDLAAPHGSVFRTSSTLFNQKPSRTVDFCGSKLLNTSDSRYAIVTVSESLETQSDAALDNFAAENHFGDQIEASNILNVVVQMSPNTSSGANLGVGIVYGSRCRIKATILASNGNAAEIRGSVRCSADIDASGHRNYGVFNYQSKWSDITGKIVGGTRGVVFKHAYFDDPYVNAYVHDCHILNTTERSITGGASANSGASAALEPAGHEIVKGVRVARCVLESDASVGISPKIVLGRHADSWGFSDILMKNASTETSTTFVSLGSEGTAGYFIGGGHVIHKMQIEGAIGDSAAQISTVVSATFSKVHVDGKMFWGIYFGTQLLPTDERPRRVIECVFTGDFVTVGATIGGIVASSSNVNSIEIVRNQFDGTAVANVAVPSRNIARLVYSEAEKSLIADNVFKIDVPSASASAVHVVQNTSTARVRALSNHIMVTNVIDSINLYGVFCSNTSSAIVGNDLEIDQNAGTPGTSHGIRYATGCQLSANVFTGSWSSNSVAF